MTCICHNGASRAIRDIREEKEDPWYNQHGISGSNADVPEWYDGELADYKRAIEEFCKNGE